MKYLALPSPEFSAYQYNLMVGSYDTAVGDVNGGKLGFYTVDGTKENIEKRVEYTGFARIQDVLYRERR